MLIATLNVIFIAILLSSIAIVVLAEFSESKIVASDSTSDSYFGCSVGIYGDYAVIGAYTHNSTNITQAGSAYIFQKIDNEWTELTQLEASDKKPYDFFGHTVGISDEYVAIAAPYKIIDSQYDVGAVYLYKKTDNWSETYIITPNEFEADPNTYFGYSISLKSDYLLIGTLWNYNEVYVYKRNVDESWNEIDILAPADNITNNHFGSTALCLDENGKYAAISATGDDDAGLNTGAVYIFERNEDDMYTEITKLTSPNAATNNYFGTAVSIYDGYIVISEVSQWVTARIYIYQINIDNNEIELIQTIEPVENKCGRSLVIYENYIIVACPSETSFTMPTYVYERNITSGTWSQIDELTPSDKVWVLDEFGGSVGMEGNNIIISRIQHENLGDSILDTGSVYIFENQITNTLSPTGQPTSTTSISPTASNTATSATPTTSPIEDDQSEDGSTYYRMRFAVLITYFILFLYFINLLAYKFN